MVNSLTLAYVTLIRKIRDSIPELMVVSDYLFYVLSIEVHSYTYSGLDQDLL